MSSDICNFISIKDQYTPNIGKINITTNKFDLYLNDKLIRKNDLNIKITTNDLVEIINYINNNNKYVIHIINIVYDSSPSYTIIDNVPYLNYCKTIFIDNCGNIYIGCIIFNEVKQMSIYPKTTKAFKNVSIEYPDNIKSDPLPNFLILLIKNIHDNFVFRSFDYTANTIDTIKNITNIAYFNTEFRQEYNKHIEVINQQGVYISNILDVEIQDYKVKHEHHIKSLQDIIKYLEYENMSYYATLKETADKNTMLTNQLIEKNNLVNQFDHDIYMLKKELVQYNNNYLITILMYMWDLIKFLLFIK